MRWYRIILFVIYYFNFNKRSRVDNTRSLAPQPYDNRRVYSNYYNRYPQNSRNYAYWNNRYRISRSTTTTSTTTSTTTTTFISTSTSTSNLTTTSIDYFNETFGDLYYHERCIIPAINSFPPDLFGETARSKGLFIVHVIVICYLFLVLAIICDEYFVSAMGKCCTKLGLSEDVAGATFMAAGSSAPELFTSIIGVFITKGDVGLGTIVGSAVFNIVFVIGVCGVISTTAAKLSWWPLTRDSIYYSISVIALILVVYDSRVTWYESLILLILYILYVTMMMNNEKIYAFIKIKYQEVFNAVLEEEDDDFVAGEHSLINNAHSKNVGAGKYEQFTDEELYPNLEKPVDLMSVDQLYYTQPHHKDFSDMGLRMMITRYFRQKTRFKMAGKLIVAELKYWKMKNYQVEYQKNTYQNSHGINFDTMNRRLRLQHKCSVLEASEDLVKWRHRPPFEPGYRLQFIWWLLTFPIHIIFHYTIPDCRKEKYENWYPLTFTVTLFYIAVFSYILVWMVTILGHTFHISDSIMGITFLAAGTSVPDALASIIVVKHGFVDMGVSNTFGSNLFDILLGLALPWFIQACTGKPVRINSNGLFFNIILLFGCIAVTIGIIRWAKWYLDRRIGIIFLVIYATYILFSVLIESNVFGYVNPPMCDE
ncbi:hypothetical protein SNEBB_004653 [Seison nebaliae]|nr:hypothetical protein SNEBB_004653 [Seison nebaliae]